MSKNWESPISITEEICREMAEAYDAYIVEEVRKVIPHIDKEELVKALEYDRGQYEKGYADGKESAVKHGHWERTDIVMYSHNAVRCSVCGILSPSYSKSHDPFCRVCGAKMDEVTDGV